MIKTEYIEPPTIVTVESLAEYISQIASVVFDRDKVQKPMKRFRALMKEAYGDSPSSVLEFIPCVLKSGDESDCQQKWFGYFIDDKYYTNLRELLDWDYPIDECLPYIDFEHFKTYKITAPYFIFGQLSRHKEEAVVSHSQRYAVSKHGYWYPPEFEVYHANSTTPTDDIQKVWNDKVIHYSPDELRHFMKKTLGINRKEIYDRGSDMLELRTFCLGGYTNNKYQWDWLIKQRTDDHTQLETRDLVKTLKQRIGK